MKNRLTHTEWHGIMLKLSDEETQAQRAWDEDRNNEKTWKLWRIARAKMFRQQKSQYQEYR